MEMLGVDVGGSGIKGAPVDLGTGELTAERLRVPTPEPSAPAAVAAAVAQVVEHFGGDGPVGVTFPGVVVDGTTLTAANVNHGWIGLDAAELLGRATGRRVTLLNDADAAGIAEMTHGAGRGRAGTVVLLTLGTGIGSALFVDGTLVPNTEFGHIEIRGKDAEHRAAARVRKDKDLTWEQWAERLSEYLQRLEGLISPSLIVLGGGVSRKADKFVPLIEGVRAPIVPAALRNTAGIVGAAMAAARTAGPVQAHTTAPATAPATASDTAPASAW
ncbi:polyphosphate--glucose phosphotransferase [Actinomadura harenae]|uniref:ROK family protein n=1 Tax=Actinomadura harenae TaxID=2483351 RepID=A0A3M2LUF9_9ACTN|nr:ROK family protein [Actinomadura harenae]RMI41114.1 ROK family protein [Actinomadura harenae]